MDENRLSPNEVWTLVQTDFPLLARLWRERYVVSEASRHYPDELESTWPRQLADVPNDVTRGYLSRVELLLGTISEISGFAKLGPGLRSTIDQGIATVHHITSAAWLDTQANLLAVEQKSATGSVIDCVIDVDGQRVNVECFAPGHRPSTRIGMMGMHAWMESSDGEYLPRVQRIEQKGDSQLPTDTPGVISLRPKGPLGHSWVQFARDGIKSLPHVVGAILWMRNPQTGIRTLNKFDDAFPHWIPNPQAGGCVANVRMPWERCTISNPRLPE